jgi:ATP-dependent Lon protease
VSIDGKLVSDNERMLTSGFYAEVDLTYDAVIAQEKNGRPFAIAALRPIQLSKRDVLTSLYEGRSQFATVEWKHFLLRSIGLEPSAVTERNADVMILRMVPFVEANYNLVELGPRGTVQHDGW